MSEVKELTQEEKIIEKLKKQSDGLVEQSKALVIVENGIQILRSAEEKVEAGILMKEASFLKKTITDSYNKILDPLKEAVKKANEAKKNAVSEMEKQLEIPTQAYNLLSKAIGEFDAKERREAEKKAQATRKIIEEARLAEAAKKEEEAKLLEEKADALAESGKIDEAKEIFRQSRNIQEESEQLIDDPIPVVQIKKSGKIEGMRTTDYYFFEVTDEEVLVKYLVAQIIAGRTEFYRYLSANDKELRADIKKKKKVYTIPGGTIRKETKVSTT